MNRNAIISVGVVAVVVVVVSLVWRSSGERPIKRKLGTNAESVSSVPNALTDSALSKRGAVAASQNNTEGRAELSKKQFWENLFSSPIVFYGKVVDEGDQPVQQATVEASFANSAAGKNATMAAETDSNGRFSFSGQGLGISVGVSKNGYYRVKESDGVFAYREEAGQLDRHSDPNRPAIFKLRKMGTGRELIFQGVGGKLVGDGRPIGISLKTGERTPPERADLVLEVWVDQQNRPNIGGRQFGWKCRDFHPKRRSFA